MATLEEALVVGRGTERPINCPNPNHADEHASASLNVIKGVWFCYGCSSKGSVAGHIPDPKQAMKLLTEADQKPRVYPWAWLDLFDADHPSSYWSTRFGTDTAALFRCGTDPLTGEPTYPLLDPQGNCLGVVRRNDSGQGPKYRYPYRVRTSQCLFLSPWAAASPEVLVLVEGAADVMALHQGGLPRGWRAAGCYGAGVHEPQRQIIAAMGPRKIVLAFDDDEAGRKAMDAAYSHCAAIAPSMSVAWSSMDANYPFAKDPAELPPDRRTPALVNTLQGAHA